MRKKLLTLTFVVTFSTIFVGSVYNNAHTNPDGSPNSRTGSPGDGGNTCAISGCHTGFTVGTKTNVFSSTIPSEGYTPGTKYTITATAKSSANRNTFGFQLSPQTSTGALVGTMTVTSQQTKLTGGGKYLTHTFSGITGSGGVKSWSFDWTAPAAGTGDVTFYGAFNHANGNGGTTGDSIFKTTYVIKEKVVQGVSNNSLASLGFSVFPNPASDYLFLANNHSVKFDRLRVYDLSGKLIYELEDSNFETQVKFDLSNFAKGMYFLKLSMNNEELGATKFVVK
jgi:Secretion system C-terminal sorting domain/Reeler domain